MGLFSLDHLSLVTFFLTLLIGLPTCMYARNYLQGDLQKKKYLLLLCMQLLFTTVLSLSDHIMLLGSMLFLNNVITASLITHKTSWKASLNSGLLAFRYLSGASFCMISGLLLLGFLSQELSIQKLLNRPFDDPLSLIAGSLILAGACLQCATWPCHKWLISSTNAPTPTSALMHAGVVNYGILLICRFSPLFVKHPSLMVIMFTVGVVSALIGNVWKLVQPSIKGMLACSTISQMGFSLALCGLGLFPAALSHVFFHALFKAYGFLASNTFDASKNTYTSPNTFSFCLALSCGAIASYLFMLCNPSKFQSLDTSLWLLTVVALGGAQLALHMLRSITIGTYLTSLFVSAVWGCLYGLSVKCLSTPELRNYPLPLNNWHLLCLVAYIAIWIVSVLSRRFALLSHKKIYQRLYVAAVVASQPKRSCVSSCKTHYSYL